MRFILSDQESAVSAVASRLTAELAVNQRVLWLLSGGSNIEAAVGIMQNIPEELTSRLTVMPIDERFGAPGHADSNWYQLERAGFAQKQANTLPVLQSGQSFADACTYYETIAAEAFAGATVCIGLLGMGADGHIAGILPGSDAVTTRDRLVCAYESQPYKRLTLTYAALERLTAAYVLTFGESKRAALERLRDQTVPLTEQPAQFLKQLNEVCVYNDRFGEAA